MPYLSLRSFYCAAVLALSGAGTLQAAPSAAIMPPSVLPRTVDTAAPRWEQLRPEQQRERRSQYAAWRAMSES